MMQVLLRNKKCVSLVILKYCFVVYSVVHVKVAVVMLILPLKVEQAWYRNLQLQMKESILCI